MLATRGVEALVGDHQSLDRLIADDVRVNDLVNIGRGNVAVPDGFRINDNRWAVLALVKTPGFVSADGAFDSALCEFGLEGSMKVSVAGAIAAATRMIVRTLVGADKDVLFELRHYVEFTICGGSTESQQMCRAWCV